MVWKIWLKHSPNCVRYVQMSLTDWALPKDACYFSNCDSKMYFWSRLSIKRTDWAKYERSESVWFTWFIIWAKKLSSPPGLKPGVYDLLRPLVSSIIFSSHYSSTFYLSISARSFDSCSFPSNYFSIALFSSIVFCMASISFLIFWFSPSFMFIKLLKSSFCFCSWFFNCSMVFNELTICWCLAVKVSTSTYRFLEFSFSFCSNWPRLPSSSLSLHIVSWCT